MDKDYIETIALFLGCCWLFYKWYKTKNPRSLFSAVLVVLLLPSRWPLFLPVQFSFSLMAFCAVVFLFLEARGKLKRKPHSYFYILLFLVFGFAFLVEAFFKYRQLN
jgi:hypothetical protein